MTSGCSDQGKIAFYIRNSTLAMLWFILAIFMGILGSVRPGFCMTQVIRPILRDVVEPVIPDELDVRGLKILQFRATMSDGATLPGHVIYPSNIEPGKKLPFVLFVHSWLLNQLEYVAQEVQFAKQGFVTACYDCRGWYGGEGKSDFVGPQEMDDLSSIIDHVLEIAPVDPEKIGVAGVSYGGGTSLLSVAFEPRIKAAFSMSGWADFNDALMPNHSGKGLWDLLLALSGNLLADPTANDWRWINAYINKDPEGIAKADAAIRERSAITYIDKINQRRVPIYIHDNINDDLFTSRPAVKFFEQLTVPKKLALLNGIHATGEMPGMLFMSSWIWDEAYKWFAQWLKGEPTGIMQEPAVHIYTKWNDSLAAFEDFPINDTSLEFYLDQEKLIPETPPAASRVFTIENGILSDTNSGTPIISPLLYSYANVPVKETWKIGGNSVSFVTEPFQEHLTIMGLPQAKVFLRPDAPVYQFDLFLYDLGPSGRGEMIAHIPYTEYSGQVGSVTPITLDFNLVSYRLEPNHRIKLVISTYDPSAQLLMTDRFSLDILAGGATTSSLTLPVQTKMP